MTSPRFLIVLFSAVLTAGMARGTSTSLFIVTSGHGDVLVDGVDVAFAPTASLVPLQQDLTDGWHEFSVDFKSGSGSNNLTLWEGPSSFSVGWIGLSSLGYFDAAKVAHYGLKADFYNVNGDGTTGSLLKTQYTDGYLNFVTGTAPWTGLPSRFEERLTGYYWVGSGEAPLETLTPPGGTGGGTGGGGGDSSNVPEPAGWVFMLAGIPAILVSRGLGRVAVRRSKSQS